MSENGIKNKDLEAEWVQLILQAKRIGITKDEIRKFLNKNQMGSSAIKLGNIHTYEE